MPERWSWQKYDCIGCHTIFGNGSYFAPDMTKVVDRKPKSYLKKFLMDPKAVKADAAMPTLGITSDEADKLLAFLDWISKVDTNGLAAQADPGNGSRRRAEGSFRPGSGSTRNRAAPPATPSTASAAHQDRT